MKIRFNREEMAAGLGAICGVVATRTPKEILRCVRLEAHSDFVLLSATDLEMGLRCTVTQVEVDESGETLVTADTLTRIVRESTDDLLALETEENVLHVRGVMPSMVCFGKRKGIS
jgi:DNA polymerase-3 subunit beta